MSARVYVPGDAGATSVGADAVAQAIAREGSRGGGALELIRNGSRGAYWLQPLVEVATPRGRVAYGPVTAADVPGLFAGGFFQGGPHPLALCPTHRLPRVPGPPPPPFQPVR